MVPNTSQQFQTYTKARVVLTTADTIGSPNGFLLVVAVVFQIHLKINLNSSVTQLFSIFNQLAPNALLFLFTLSHSSCQVP